MIVYLSGGSQIAETGVENPAIMLSFFVVVNKHNRPNSRLRAILEIRRKARAKEVKCPPSKNSRSRSSGKTS